MHIWKLHMHVEHVKTIGSLDSIWSFSKRVENKDQRDAHLEATRPHEQAKAASSFAISHGFCDAKMVAIFLKKQLLLRNT